MLRHRESAQMYICETCNRVVDQPKYMEAMGVARFCEAGHIVSQPKPIRDFILTLVITTGFFTSFGVLAFYAASWVPVIGIMLRVIIFGVAFVLIALFAFSGFKLRSKSDPARRLASANPARAAGIGIVTVLALSVTFMRVESPTLQILLNILGFGALHNH